MNSVHPQAAVGLARAQDSAAETFVLTSAVVRQGRWGSAFLVFVALAGVSSNLWGVPYPAGGLAPWLGDTLGGALWLAGLIAGGVYATREVLFAPTRQRVMVDGEGLLQQGRRQRTKVAWTDIASLREHLHDQRIDVIDAAGTKRAELHFQLGDYQRLLNLVMERSAAGHEPAALPHLSARTPLSNEQWTGLAVAFAFGLVPWVFGVGFSALMTTTVMATLIVMQMRFLRRRGEVLVTDTSLVMRTREGQQELALADLSDAWLGVHTRQGRTELSVWVTHRLHGRLALPRPGGSDVLMTLRALRTALARQPDTGQSADVAETRCARHPERPSEGTCDRCGDFACGACLLPATPEHPTRCLACGGTESIRTIREGPSSWDPRHALDAMLRLRFAQAPKVGVFKADSLAIWTGMLWGLPLGLALAPSEGSGALVDGVLNGLSAHLVIFWIGTGLFHGLCRALGSSAPFARSAWVGAYTSVIGAPLAPAVIGFAIAGVGAPAAVATAFAGVAGLLLAGWILAALFTAARQVHGLSASGAGLVTALLSPLVLAMVGIAASLPALAAAGY